MKNTLQIQSVIYKNSQKSLVRAIEGIDNALKVCKERGIELETYLCYGDASPERIFSEMEVEKIGNQFKNITFRYDYFGFNSGTAKGHNKLGENCSTDYMMIMNPDIIMDSGCIAELMSVFADEKVGLAEARQTPLELAKIYDEHTLETEWASTACCIFRTSIFHKLQGFDYETFFMYCDDLDFSWRLRLEGYKIIYNPNAIVYHAKNLSNNGEWKPTAAEIYYSAEAAILMAYKYSNPDRVEKLLAQFDTIGGADEKKAANEFRRKREKGELPNPIDPNHNVAKFLGDNYSIMRYFYN